MASTSRRRFLSRGTAFVGGALAAETTLAAEPPNGPPNIPEWMKAPGADT